MSVKADEMALPLTMKMSLCGIKAAVVERFGQIVVGEDTKVRESK